MGAYLCNGKNHTCYKNLSVSPTAEHRVQQQKLATLLKDDFISCLTANELADCLNLEGHTDLPDRGLKMQRRSEGDPLIGVIFGGEVTSALLLLKAKGKRTKTRGN